MRPSHPIGTIVSVAITALVVLAQQPQRPVITSPEILADRSVVFRLWAPKANDVQLTGDWMGPAPPAALSKDESGVWSVTQGPFEPNIYTYGFLINGVRASDPSCRCTLAWAGRAESSKFVIAGSPPNPWEERAVPKGTLHHETYFSVRQQRLRKFVVYTPAEYRQSDSRKYPVFVLLSGIPGEETDWTAGGGFAELMFDNLIAEKKMRRMIVVMHASAVIPRSGIRAENLKEFEPLLVNELIPEIRKRYQAARSADLWAIAGLSLGGEFAMTVGLRHPELFRTAASLSGSMVERDFADHFGKVLANPSAVAKYRLIWIGCGTGDIFFGGNKALAAKLASAGIKNQFVELSGFHAMPVFRR